MHPVAWICLDGAKRRDKSTAMNRALGFAIFFGVAIAVIGGVHYYLWTRLIRAPALSRPWSTVLTVLLAVLALSIPLALLVGRSFAESKRLLVWPAFIWLGLMFLLFFLLLGTDLGRLVSWLWSRLAGREIDPERRLFIARGIAGAAAAGAAGLGAIAVRSALGPVTVERVEVTLPRLHPLLDGTTLVQITDLHVGPTIGRTTVAEVVARTNALQPDIVVITGDLIDGTVAELGEAVAPLRDLRARHGTFFVTGNHEYFSGAPAWVEELGRLGIKVLRNERVRIGDGEATFDLAGTDDRSAARYRLAGHGEDLAAALAGRDPSRPVVLLAHQPRTVLDAAELGVDLQLSGHTHGGQIWPWGFLVRLQQRFLAGLARHRDTLIYVSRGTGYWGPPMRLGAPPELAQIVLRAPARG
jgi:uncharacterized protein